MTYFSSPKPWHYIRDAFHSIQTSIYLTTCKGCENTLAFPDEVIICRECDSSIAINLKPVCHKCGRIMDNHSFSTLCGECLLNPPIFRKHVSYDKYGGILKKLILRYKYGNIESLKYLWVECYCTLFYAFYNESFDYIIPVPADHGRKREFAHILEVSKLLSSRLNIPILPNNLIKFKQTVPQAGLSRAKRLKNLDNAFKLTKPGIIKGKKILLIDDIYTTGTTIDRCTRLLVQNHAEVCAMTLARS